jgi:hypothetical protein
MTKEEATEFARKVYMTMPEEFEKARLQLFTCKWYCDNRVMISVNRNDEYGTDFYFIDEPIYMPIKKIAQRLLGINRFTKTPHAIYSVTW